GIMKRIKRIRWLLLGIAAASLILYIVWPRSRLVLCTTPTMTGSSSARVTLLIPRGWDIDRTSLRNFGDISAVMVTPVDRFSWVPAPIHRILPKPEAKGWISIGIAWHESKSPIDNDLSI